MSETSNLKIVAPDANSVLVPLHSHFAALASSTDQAITDRFQVKHLRYETIALRDEEYNSTTGEPVDETTGKPPLADGDMCTVLANKRQFIWNVNPSTTTWMPVTKQFLFTNKSERDAMLGEDIYEGDTCYVSDLDRSYIYDGAFWVTTDGLVQIVPQGSQIVVTGSGATGTVDDYGNIAVSTATSVSISGIFTSRFRHYKIIYTVDSSANDYVNFQLSTDGTANANASYFYGGFSQTSTATAFQTGANGTATFGRIGYASGGSNFANSMSFEVLNPQQPVYTRVHSRGHYSNVGNQYWASFNVATVFDGIRIVPATGTTTHTGSIKIYGYN
jgi:hypothetical protein